MHNLPFTNGKHNKTEKREKKLYRKPQQKKCKNGQRQKWRFALSSIFICVIFLTARAFLNEFPDVLAHILPLMVSRY